LTFRARDVLQKNAACPCACIAMKADVAETKLAQNLLISLQT
jgi:hypothetical protein